MSPPVMRGSIQNELVVPAVTRGYEYMIYYTSITYDLRLNSE